MLIRGAEVHGTAGLDLRVVGGRIAEIGRGLEAGPGEPSLEANGGALLPGLHDHHLHLFALAAARRSVQCGPPETRGLEPLRDALRAAESEWIRGVGYHESVAGALDRDALDALVADRPVRIQHRSGALWYLNSAAIERLALDRVADEPGIERDARGRPTGRLFRMDRWLRERVDRAPPPSLGAVGAELARSGVTGMTDATPHNGPSELAAFTRAIDHGELPQRLLVMGAGNLPESEHARIERGALKLLLDEPALPALDDLEQWIAGAHAAKRNVAVHCVTRTELILALAAFQGAGVRAGDRIEHASVAPPDALDLIASRGLSVVTQPGFIFARGDQYARDVDLRDRPWLYRCRGFLERAIPLGAGTDAPFGEPDPWRAMRAAVDRRSRGGLVLGPDEGITPERALELFTTSASDPGGPPRRLRAGEPADLCLLDRPWARARDQLSRDAVAATLCAGNLAWCTAPTRAPPKVE